MLQAQTMGASTNMVKTLRMGAFHLSAALLFFAGLVFGPLPVSAASAVPPNEGSVAAETVLRTLTAGPARWFASTNPAHNNDDYVVIKPGQTLRVPLAAGRLERLWCTGKLPEKLELSLANGAALSPLLRDGKALLGDYHEKAWVYYPQFTNQAAVRDLKPGAALVVVNKASVPNQFFYQVSVRPGAVAPPPFLGAPQQLTSRSQTLPSGGKSAPLPVTLKGRSGVVSELRITVAPATFETLSKLYLRVDRLRINSAAHGVISSTQEGQSRAVSVPLAAFAGLFYDVHEVHNAMMSFDGHTFLSRWPMPFDGAHDDVQISLENGGATAVEVSLSAQVQPTVHPIPFLFCAMPGSARTQRGVPLQLLHVTGAGALVGLNLGCAPSADSARRTFAYLEGNETIVADGVRQEGTGTEDFFNSAWYFPARSFDRSWWGVTYRGAMPPKVAAYRLLLQDAVTWRKELRFQLESGRRNNSDDLDYRWVAFWYQKSPLHYEIADNLRGADASASSPIPLPRSHTSWYWVVAVIAALVVIGWTLKRNRRI
jgi:hypothetical protein